MSKIAQPQLEAHLCGAANILRGRATGQDDTTCILNANVQPAVIGRAYEYLPQRPHGRAAQSDPFFTLMADADGEGFVQCGDAVAMVPLTDSGDALLVVEYSPAFGREILTLVSGSIEPEESLAEAANRELQEELGYRADRLDFLGELHPFKYLTTRVFVFLARELAPSKLAGDEAHAITERRVPLTGFTDLCRAGKLQDALGIAALFLARDYLARDEHHMIMHESR